MKTENTLQNNAMIAVGCILMAATSALMLFLPSMQADRWINPMKIVVHGVHIAYIMIGATAVFLAIAGFYILKLQREISKTITKKSS